MPKESILGALLCNLYSTSCYILQDDKIPYHIYAEDAQIYFSPSPNDYSPIPSVSVTGEDQLVDTMEFPSIKKRKGKCFVPTLIVQL